jgi:hypothetical protein
VGDNSTGGRLDRKYWRINLRELPFDLDRLLERDCEPFKPFMSQARASFHSATLVASKQRVKHEKDVFLAHAPANSTSLRTFGSQLPFSLDWLKSVKLRFMSQMFGRFTFGRIIPHAGQGCGQGQDSTEVEHDYLR